MKTVNAFIKDDAFRTVPLFPISVLLPCERSSAIKAKIEKVSPTRRAISGAAEHAAGGGDYTAAPTHK